MANTPPKAVSTEGLDVLYSAVQNDVHTHKSLDFSNLGMPHWEGTNENSKQKYLRQFHQMRIFVKDFTKNKGVGNANYGMFRHGKVMQENTYLISSNLPESINYRLGSKWSQPLSDFNKLSPNAMMQVVGNQFSGNFSSGSNRAATLKVWESSEPLQLVLRIPVIDDGSWKGTSSTTGVKPAGANTNFVEALEFLGSLCLPNYLNNKFGFYTPPPSPLNLKIQYGKESSSVLALKATYARIILQLGGVLLVDNCIIDGIQVEYPNTKTMIRHNYPDEIRPGTGGNDYLTPLLAYVTITISTVEALTIDTYSRMLWLKTQSEQGGGMADVYGAVTGAAKQAKSLGAQAWDAVTSILPGGGGGDSNLPPSE